MYFITLSIVSRVPNLVVKSLIIIDTSSLSKQTKRIDSIWS